MSIGMFFQFFQNTFIFCANNISYELRLLDAGLQREAQAV